MILQRYLTLFWRWLWLMLLMTLLAGGAAYLVSRPDTLGYSSSNS
jgi:hypothetical protein